MKKVFLSWLFVSLTFPQFISAKEAKPLGPANFKEAIASGRPIQTGAGTQAEMTFPNGVLVRLGQNSIFAVKQGTSRFELRRGAMLVRAPRSAGEILITTGSAVSSVAGTTSLIEHYPEAYTKLLSIEGTARMFMPGHIGESVLVEPGQLIMFHLKPAPTGLPNPVDFDIQRLMATSRLIKGYPPLGSESSIAAKERDQKKQKSAGALADTNLVIFGRGTLVSLTPATPDDQLERLTGKPTPTPTPKR